MNSMKMQSTCCCGGKGLCDLPRESQLTHSVYIWTDSFDSYSLLNTLREMMLVCVRVLLHVYSGIGCMYMYMYITILGVYGSGF